MKPENYKNFCYIGAWIILGNSFFIFYVTLNMFDKLTILPIFLGSLVMSFAVISSIIVIKEALKLK